MVIVQNFGILLYAVSFKVEVGAGDVDRAAMGQVTAMAQIHAQYGIAGLEHCEVNSHIGIGAAVRLHIGMLCTEKFFRPFPSQVLCDIHEFAAAIIAFAGIAFCVFVGHNAALSRHDSWADKVFGGDQLNFFLLSFFLQKNSLCQLWIDGRNQFFNVIHHLPAPSLIFREGQSSRFPKSIALFQWANAHSYLIPGCISPARRQ